MSLLFPFRTSNFGGQGVLTPPLTAIRALHDYQPRLPSHQPTCSKCPHDHLKEATLRLQLHATKATASSCLPWTNFCHPKALVNSRWLGSYSHPGKKQAFLLEAQQRAGTGANIVFHLYKVLPGSTQAPLTYTPILTTQAGWALRWEPAKRRSDCPQFQTFSSGLLLSTWDLRHY